ncbi:galactose oxidase [Aaosphaeria arxii CBS 175.79]|uniref:Galactose oxidase n=1 Tax=Aaosphaeria arxii CBS 175.79 TaxID=1450172 RepID=A0A6A5XAD6_9PLEO|nr:galactose oxidase [Aaosphaeria arxii CBS 175.79]KAF2009880.1 galactose oxidase [Aaosphaeria arxii CBS 175.79]
MLLLQALLIASSALAYPNQIHPTWTSLANITIAPRQEHTTVFLPPSTLAILGGIASIEFPPPTSNLMQFYSIPENTWTVKAPLPVPLNHVNVAVSCGKIYVLGGLVESEGETPPAWRASPESWVYDPRTDQWTSIAPLPADEARGSAAVGVHGNKIYLAGGMKALILGQDGLQDTVSVVSIYDTTLDEWITVPNAAKNIPEGRDHSGAAVVKDVFYILGGRDHGQFNVKDTVFALDLNNVQRGWVTKPGRMPTPRGGLAAGTIGRKVYTFGGEGNSEVESGVFNNTEVYDTSDGSWKKLPPMKVARHGTSAVGVGNRVYIPGGGIRIGGSPVAILDAFLP